MKNCAVISSYWPPRPDLARLLTLLSLVIIARLSFEPNNFALSAVPMIAGTDKGRGCSHEAHHSHH